MKPLAGTDAFNGILKKSNPFFCDASNNSFARVSLLTTFSIRYPSLCIAVDGV